MNPIGNVNKFIEDVGNINARSQRASCLSTVGDILAWPSNQWSNLKGLVTAPIARGIVRAGKAIPIANKWHQRKCELLAAKCVEQTIEYTKLPIGKIEEAAKRGIQETASKFAELEACKKIHAIVKVIKECLLIHPLAEYLANTNWKILQALGWLLGGIRSMPMSIEEIQKKMDLKGLLTNQVYYPLICKLQEIAAENTVQAGLDMGIDIGLSMAIGPAIFNPISKAMGKANNVATALKVGFYTYVFGLPVYHGGKIAYQAYTINKQMAQIDKAIQNIDLKPLITKFNLQNLPESTARHIIKGIFLTAIETGLLTKAFGNIDLNDEQSLASIFTRISNLLISKSD